ncbi:hypothetical protein E2562_006000 [Oryza meyeriana var. granulata]|uniref:KIB1-4 beta-propeller domain-containing protein n=1 Tax=Oryza meyeriana var. granulata TaxID=110450 RepID=A0A6G1EV99_9ORYZ|nr:hypothetical protein E2562_006000 [Oryza meyeriana var. granulata]
MEFDGESGWTDLPGEIMELIADKASDACTGRTLFRSVCRPWRAAVPETPRLLIPAARRADDVSDEYALAFPLSRGWSIVVDIRDTSCHLSHMATGATAPLPRLNAVRATAASRVVHLGYEHYAMPAAIPAKKHAVTSAVHVPASTPAASTDGMLIMMHHMLHGKTGMVFCRPSDAAWTKLDNPVDDEDGSHPLSFVDFAYFDGKMFGVDRNGTTAVIDAATLEVVDLVDVPPETARVKSSKPERFDVFELGQDQDGALAWRKVAGHDVGGNYDLFLDGHHATYL